MTGTTGATGGSAAAGVGFTGRDSSGATAGESLLVGWPVEDGDAEAGSGFVEGSTGWDPCRAALVAAVSATTASDFIASSIEDSVVSLA